VPGESTIHSAKGQEWKSVFVLTLRRRPNDQMRIHELNNLAQRFRVATVVTNDVLFHESARRILQDVVTCIRHNVTIDEAGFRRERHADRYLKPPEEMARLFSRYPEALARTLEIAGRCTFSMDELAYQYPEERTMPGLTPQQALEKLTWEGAAERYPEGLPDEVRPKLEHELRLIELLQYAPYFAAHCPVADILQRVAMAARDGCQARTAGPQQQSTTTEARFLQGAIRCAEPVIRGFHLLSPLPGERNICDHYRFPMSPVKARDVYRLVPGAPKILTAFVILVRRNHSD
jgi:hypothetical protein